MYVCNEVAEYARQTTRVRGQQTPYKKAMREDDKELRKRFYIWTRTTTADVKGTDVDHGTAS